MPKATDLSAAEAPSILRVVNIVEEGRGGGPLKRISAVASQVREQGIETTVICPRRDSDAFQNDLSARGIRVRAIPLHRLTKHWTHLAMYILFFLPELFRIWRVIRSERADLVHGNGAYQLKGMLAAKLTSARAVWHLNDTHQPKLVRSLFTVVARFFADGFIVASERTRRYYLASKSFRTRPIIEIQAPVDVTLFDPDRVAPALDVTRLGRPVLTTVGNINHYKGLETFIRMANRINQAATPPVAFVIVGPIFENQRAYYDRLIELSRELGVSNLHFLGFRSDVREILKASDVYICASNFEASPISIWEAMAMGLPVVTTDVGDVRGILEQNECGLVTAVADEEQLANHALTLLSDATRRRQMGVQARRIACEKLDIRICAQRHAQFYRSMVGK